MTVTAKFRFNKAGQGSFYTGRFFHHKNDSRFSVVYDCGTSSTNKEYLQKSIWKFASNLLSHHDNTLNLLMISHFDNDHVNEVGTLLEKLKSCDTIILPYLYPEERLVIYLTQLAAGQRLTDDYLRFLINPVDFLTQFNNVGQIIFIRGNDEDDLAVINNPDQPQGPLFRPVERKEDLPLGGDDKEIKDGQLPAEQFSELGFMTQHFKSVFICGDNRRYLLHGVWYFYFYNKRNAEKKLIETFKKKVATTFKKLQATGNEIADLKDLFESKNKKALIKLYKDTFKEENLNPTSLVVLHGPYTTRKVEGWINRKNSYFYDGLKEIRRFETFLTGDLYLKGIQWPAYITNLYGRISILQIPHHGSNKKWDITVLNSASLQYPVYAILNFGLGNSYDHPRPEVVSDIKALAWKIKLVHELKSFRYHIRIN